MSKIKWTRVVYIGKSVQLGKCNYKEHFTCGSCSHFCEVKENYSRTAINTNSTQYLIEFQDTVSYYP